MDKNTNKENIQNFQKNDYKKLLINKLINDGVVQTKKVAQTLYEVDRADFVGDQFPYNDWALPIGYNVVISAPHLHAHALECLKDFLKPGNRVLDVGSGSGYLTAAFSKMMDDKGIVVGIEHIPELYEIGYKNISRSHSNLIEEQKIILLEGDGRLGCPEYGPFNCIHVGAAADKIPDAFVHQLAKGGRLVIPAGPPGNQYTYVIDKDMEGNITWANVLSVNYVPLTSKEMQLMTPCK
jgi:protein-L-isoaspartate(D-aspartate) O-methyltransferase